MSNPVKRKKEVQDNKIKDRLMRKSAATDRMTAEIYGEFWTKAMLHVEDGKDAEKKTMRAHAVMRAIASTYARMERLMEKWQMPLMETQVDIALGKHQGLLDYVHIDNKPERKEKGSGLILPKE